MIVQAAHQQVPDAGGEGELAPVPEGAADALWSASFVFDDSFMTPSWMECGSHHADSMRLLGQWRRRWHTVPRIGRPFFGRVRAVCVKHV